MKVIQAPADFSASPPAHHMAGSGPHGTLEYLLVFAGLVIVIFVTIYTIKFLIKPQEQNVDHIKRRVLEDEF